MDEDDEIPVLTEAVRRKAGGALSEEQIDELCDTDGRIREDKARLLRELTA